MATKKKETTKEIAIGKVKLMPAVIIEPANSDKYADIDKPDFLSGEDVFEKESADGFTPIISFGRDSENWDVGSWVVGRFVGIRGDIGPNKSNMYDFEMVNEKGSTIASLWGTTILDNKFSQLDPRPGQWVYIQYLGTVPTSRGQSEAKDFRLGIVKDSAIESLMKRKSA